MLIRHIGTDRFGILTIAWMVVGYFSLFDLGLGRAMTNLVAQRLGGDRQNELPAVVWTANGIMAVMGIVGALVLAAISPSANAYPKLAFGKGMASMEPMVLSSEMEAT